MMIMTVGLTIGLMTLMFLVFIVLTTFLSSTKSYAVISLVPLALGLTLFALRAVSNPADYSFADLCEKVIWATSIQTALGIVLVARALYRRRPLALLTFATLVTGSMVWLRIFRWL